MSDFDKIWKEEIANVNEALEEFLLMKKERAHYLGLIHDQFYDNIREYIMRGGKRLRPMAVGVAYRAVKDELDVKHLYRAACALEILHNGSLLHDDLIDHDETRRGGPTFHATYREWFKSQFGAKEEKANDFGMTMAILGGDSLINLGSEAISQSELDPDVALQCLRWYQMGFSDLVEGVLLEMMMIRDPEVPIETYLEMVRLKTATLFQKALLFGAKMAGASDSQLDGFSEFGVKVGQAFQVQDDILGSFGDEAETGKSSSGDIREGKKTMLLIQALKLSNADQRKVLDDLLGKDDMTEEEVEKVRQVFKKSGALDATKELMERLLREGQAALKNANPPLKPRFLEFLLELSEFLTSRAF